MANKKNNASKIVSKALRMTNTVSLIMTILFIAALTVAVLLYIKPISECKLQHNPECTLEHNAPCTLPHECDKTHKFNDKTLSEGATLKIHFLNVGQGDSAFVQFPDGKNAIIDAGSGTTDPSATRTNEMVLSYLNALEITTIDYMFATHPDSDHINMLDNILDTYAVKNIYYNDFTHTSATFAKFVQKAESEVQNENAVIVKIDNDGENYDFGTQSYDFKVFAPGHGRFDSVKDKNAMSFFTYIAYNEKKILLTGDAEIETEEWLLKQTFIDSTFDIDLLKVGHHGSSSSSSTPFLNKIKPEYGVISVASENSYNHPHGQAVTRLFDAEVTVYQTNIHGVIQFMVDKDGNMAFKLQNKRQPTFNPINRDPLQMAS